MICGCRMFGVHGQSHALTHTLMGHSGTCLLGEGEEGWSYDFPAVVEHRAVGSARTDGK